MLDNFTELLILAYFKECNDDYSLLELKETIGVSLETLDEFVDELIKNQLLYWNENHMISLTQKGRICLMNSRMENYCFRQVYNCEDVFPENWPINRPYCVSNFRKYKWRGTDQ